MDGVAFGQASTNVHIIGSKFVNSSIFLYYSPVWTDGKELEVVNMNGSVFSNTVLRVPRNVDRVSFNDIFFKNTNSASSDGLYLYDMTAGSLSNVHIKKNDANDKLYYTTIDAANAITYTDVVTPTLTP